MIVAVVAVLAGGAAIVAFDRTADDSPVPVGAPTTSPAAAPAGSEGSLAPVKKAPAKGTFHHPGALLGADEIADMKARVDAGAEPQASAFKAMSASRYADPGWRPRARAVVECGPFSNPDEGCSEEADDAVAAYTQALLWTITGRKEHAEAAIRIIDAWAAVLKRHTNVNGPLQSAWSAAPMARAAEIVRHTYEGWDPAGAEQMFRDVYLPEVIKGATWTNGNWELIMMDAATSMAVFLDDTLTWDRAIKRFQGRIKAYVYLESDGPLPAAPPGTSNVSKSRLVKYWQGQRTFVDGLSQETCRDFGHAGWGLSAAAHVAETARLQGLDLWKEIEPRMTAALEFHARYARGAKAPDWLCGGDPDADSYDPPAEVSRRHYVDRLGLDLPETVAYVTANRPAGAAYFYSWETLTHG